MKNTFYFSLNIILLLIPSIYTGFFPGKIVAITIICMNCLLLLTIYKIFLQKEIEITTNNYKIILIYFISNLIIFTRGIFDLSSNQDYITFFSNIIFVTLFYPLYLIIIKKNNIVYILKSIIFIGIPISFVTYLYKPTDGFMTFQQNISIIYLLILMIPYLNKKWIVIILILSIIGITYDMTRRSFFINCIVSFLIVGSYYIFTQNMLKKIAKIFFIISLISPIILLLLGLTGIFNIFKIGENTEVTIKNSTYERSALVDSRTAIYYDVFSELTRQKSIIFGLGGNGKTQTTLSDLSDDYYLTYKEGRRNTESGMLNYFQWGGILSAFSYYLLLCIASYNAIYKSRNIFFLLLGIFMSFKIMYSFIEDNISTNTMSFYIMLSIGLCYNKTLKNLNNQSIKKMISYSFKY